MDHCRSNVTLRYCYAMGFQSLIMAAADLADFWGLSNALKVIVLFVACPFTLYWINYLGVWVRRYFLRTYST